MTAWPSSSLLKECILGPSSFYVNELVPSTAYYVEPHHVFYREYTYWFSKVTLFSRFLLTGDLPFWRRNLYLLVSSHHGYFHKWLCVGELCNSTFSSNFRRLLDEHNAIQSDFCTQCALCFPASRSALFCRVINFERYLASFIRCSSEKQRISMVGQLITLLISQNDNQLST